MRKPLLLDTSHVILNLWCKHRDITGLQSLIRPQNDCLHRLLMFCAYISKRRTWVDHEDSPFDVVLGFVARHFQTQYLTFCQWTCWKSRELVLSKYSRPFLTTNTNPCCADIFSPWMICSLLPSVFSLSIFSVLAFFSSSFFAHLFFLYFLFFFIYFVALAGKVFLKDFYNESYDKL